MTSRDGIIFFKINFERIRRNGHVVDFLLTDLKYSAIVRKFRFHSTFEGAMNHESQFYPFGRCWQVVESKETCEKSAQFGEASEMRNEIKSIKVTHIIVHSGTNDIPLDSRESCIKNIQNLALCVKEKFPRSTIAVSSITVRHDHADLNDRILMVNKKLQELHAKNELEFINNSNIDSTLNGSQLYLNAKGNAFLATNFIQFLRGGDVNAYATKIIEGSM